jgi:putative ABC transport system substrate-binding protein
VLWNPAVAYHLKVIEELKAAARSLSIGLSLASARTPEQLAPAFLAINRKRAQILFVIDDAFFSANETTLLDLAAKSRLPLIYASTEFATKGALMFYGTDLADQCRQAGGYVDKILRLLSGICG